MTAGPVDLEALLDSCGDIVKVELECMPTIEDAEDFDPHGDTTVPIDARKWLRVTDAVAVVADLKSSTQLSVGKHAASTASIYQAALKPVVDIFLAFGAGHVPIQGDCVIGIFWGDMAVERAMCAGITIKTFSRNELVTRLEAKWSGEKFPKTGFKVGIGMSDLLVKRVGRSRSPHWALVWPGKALNHASKAAQEAEAHELIVTGSVWDAIEAYDYLTFTCTCSEPSDVLWADCTISRLREDEPDRSGRKLTAQWCDVHGDEYCNAILAGNTTRDELEVKRTLAKRRWMQGALAAMDAKRREDRRNLRRARSGR
jgi:class 3 adenylate cyclase